MTIMDLVRKFSARKAVDKQKFKEAESDMKIEKMLSDRSKSSNERELEKYLHQQREDNIKKELDKIHHGQNQDMWKSKHGILDKGIPITRNDRPILQEKNIFMGNKHNTLTKGGMFFKR
jgi:hypothetical protein